MTMADEIAVMSEGHIEQRGSAVELYEAPATAFVANFLGVSNLVDAKLAGRDATHATFETHDGATVRAPADRARDGAVRIGVRPEKLHVCGEAPDGMNALRGTVEVASYLGVSLQYIVRTPGGDQMTIIEQNREDGDTVGPGREVVLAWRPEHTFVVTKEAQDAA